MIKKPSDIKVGIIGYGPTCNMGPLHFRDASSAGMTPTAVCDINPERLEQAKKDFPGIKTYSSLPAMLKDSGINLAIVITPHNTHEKIVVRCLNAGVNVICEKPMAVNTGECDRMISVAKKNRRMLAIYQSRHWDGCIMHMVKMLEKNPIGDIVRVEAHMGSREKPGDWWRGSKKMSGSILHDWGAHLMEYTFQVLKAPITEVSGFVKDGYWAPQTKWKSDTIEDEAYIVFRYADGIWSSLSYSNIDSKPKEGVLEITGTEGTYVMDHERWSLITHKDGATVTTRGRNPQGTWEKFYENIASHLTKGEPLVVPPEISRRIIHVIDLGLQSAKLKRALKPKYK